MDFSPPVARKYRESRRPRVARTLLCLLVMQAHYPVPTASAIMNSEVLTLDVSTPIAEAVQVLVQRGYSGAPVVDDAKLVGVFSEANGLDVLSKALNESWPTGSVGQYMHHEIETVGPKADLYAIVDRFTGFRVRRIAVVEAGSIIGIITRRDVMSAMATVIRARAS